MVKDGRKTNRSSKSSLWGRAMIVIDNKTVKTRKPHLCFECSSPISSGTITNVQIYSDEGRCWAIYQCPTCEDYLANNPHFISPFKIIEKHE